MRHFALILKHWWFPLFFHVSTQQIYESLVISNPLNLIRSLCDPLTLKFQDLIRFVEMRDDIARLHQFAISEHLPANLSRSFYRMTFLRLSSSAKMTYIK
jgi:hypothetical protein